MLNSKHKSQPGVYPVKLVALSAPLHLNEKAKAIAPVQQHTKSTAVAAHASLSAKLTPSPEESLVLYPRQTCQAEMTNEVDLGYKQQVISRFVF